MSLPSLKIKFTSGFGIANPLKRRTFFKGLSPSASKNLSRLKKTLGLFILFISSFLFFSQVFFPSFTAKAEDSVISPLPENYQEQQALKRLETFAFDELSSRNGSIDYQLEPGEKVPTSFEITIPRLDLKDVKVETNSVDTTPHEMLGHYKGSSLPGKSGNTFIYGHSTLPSHFDPDNYKTLFTHLPKLEEGDEIIVEYNGETLRYKVDKSEVLEPSEVDPLKRRYLPYPSISLMTCVPPGTVDKRMVVFAKKIL